MGDEMNDKDTRSEAFSDAAKSRCFTEILAAGLPNQVCVGLGDKIPRWRKESVIRYIVRIETFPKVYATHAIKSFDEAAQKWNEKLGGVGPRFERTYNSEAAVCEVMYKVRAANSNSDPLASAFFPGSSEPVVYLYAKAFEDSFRNSIVNTFYHELGHVLGLRHEFAPEREKNHPSVLVGERNALSVMNYFSHPSQYQIHDLDVEHVKEFYNLEGNTYKGLPIEDKVPQSLDSWRRVSLQTGILAKMDQLAGPILGMAAVAIGVAAVIALAAAKVGQFNWSIYRQIYPVEGTRL